MKGLYFFPGERFGNYPLYTAHPLDVRDEQWNSVPATRAWVIGRMIHANVNTIVMSYWGDNLGTPMEVGPHTLQGVLEAVQGQPIVIMPALESGPQWDFKSDFPVNPIGSAGLINRIGELVKLFSGKMDLWAKIYDRDGEQRYAVHILHAASKLISTDDPFRDEKFASGFAQVADEVSAKYEILVGFTLDTIGNQPYYSAFPSTAGKILEQTASVLAIQGFASEVFSPPDIIKNGPRCNEDWRSCDAVDNNIDNLENIANWKRNALEDWLHFGFGLPIILDVSNGFDGRIVWANADGGTGFWGDNFMYTDDRWRNWLSELKQPGIRGITFNTWNGYTEGYAAVPTHEHGSTVYNWLTDLFAPPPWDYSHMHYVNGAATHRVFGAICEKWLSLGGDRGFGAPMSDELPAGIGRKQHFEDGKTIYWSPGTGAHELHGIIRKTYISYDAEASRLGFPVSDEEATGSGRVNYFQFGRIDWDPGETIGRLLF